MVAVSSIDFKNERRAFKDVRNRRLPYSVDLPHQNSAANNPTLIVLKS